MLFSVLKFFLSIELELKTRRKSLVEVFLSIKKGLYDHHKGL